MSNQDNPLFNLDESKVDSDEKVASKSLWRDVFSGIVALFVLFFRLCMYLAKGIWSIMVWFHDVIDKKIKDKNKK